MIERKTVSSKIAIFQRKRKPMVALKPGFVSTNQGAGRTNIFAKSRFTLTDNIYHKKRHDNDKDKQNQVFQQSKGLIAGKTINFAHKRNFVDEILNKTKRTKPATNETPHECADNHKETTNVKTDTEFVASHDSLQCTDGASCHRARARITVEPRKTEML